VPVHRGTTLPAIPARTVVAFMEVSRQHVLPEH